MLSEIKLVWNYFIFIFLNSFFSFYFSFIFSKNNGKNILVQTAFYLSGYLILKGTFFSFCWMEMGQHIGFYPDTKCRRFQRTFQPNKYQFFNWHFYVAIFLSEKSAIFQNGNYYHCSFEKRVNEIRHFGQTCNVGNDTWCYNEFKISVE